jgi:outer membrane protein TolC
MRHRQHRRGQGRLLPEHSPVGQCRLPGHAAVRFRRLGFATFAFGPQLSLPIFEGGRLKGTLELREAQQQEAALNYRKVVLGAWHEIDDVLRLYNASQLRRDHLAEAVRQNRIALELRSASTWKGRWTFSMC